MVYTRNCLNAVSTISTCISFLSITVENSLGAQSANADMRSHQVFATLRYIKITINYTAYVWRCSSRMLALSEIFGVSVFSDLKWESSVNVMTHPQEALSVCEVPNQQ